MKTLKRIAGFAEWGKDGWVLFELVMLAIALGFMCFIGKDFVSLL